MLIHQISPSFAIMLTLAELRLAASPPLWPLYTDAHQMAEKETGELKRRGNVKTQKVLNVRGHEFLPTVFAAPTVCCQCKVYVWYVPPLGPALCSRVPGVSKAIGAKVCRDVYVLHNEAYVPTIDHTC